MDDREALKSSKVLREKPTTLKMKPKKEGKNNRCIISVSRT